MNLFQISFRSFCCLSCCFLTWQLKICFMLLIIIWRCLSKLTVSYCDACEALMCCFDSASLDAFSHVDKLLWALYCLSFFFCFLIICRMSLLSSALSIDIDESEAHDDVMCHFICFFCFLVLFIMTMMLFLLSAFYRAELWISF